MIIDPSGDQLAPFASKRITGVILKWKYPFYTELQNFQKPDDAVLIGIFAEQIKPKMFKGFEKYFDFVFWFKADYSKFENVYLDSNSISIPELESIIEKITTVIPKEKIRLLETEEFMIDQNCRIRETFGIPGPRTSDLKNLRDKSALKSISQDYGIPTMKFEILDFQKIKKEEIATDIVKISEKIGFPMFTKPIEGCGSGGGKKLNNEKELESFLNEKVGVDETYLIEEFIGGDDVAEFWVSSILSKDGSIKPYLNILCKRGMTTTDHLKLAYPMPFRGGSLEDTEKEFPGLRDFTIDVINKLNPPRPHIFCVQGFQLKKGSKDYLLTEVGYRINGARGTSLSYYWTGISMETALISVHLNPNYKGEPDPNRPKFFRHYLWYPSKKGKLRSQNKVPEDAPIKSRIGYNWFNQAGDELEDAQSFAHFVLFLTIDHEDNEVSERDMNWLEANYRLDIQS